MTPFNSASDAFELHPRPRGIAETLTGLTRSALEKYDEDAGVLRRDGSQRETSRAGLAARPRAAEDRREAPDARQGGGREGRERRDSREEVRLLPIRPRSRGARRSLRTFPVVTLHPRFPFNVRLTGKTFD